MNVQYLWIQDRVKHGDLSVIKVWGKDNPADLMTKHLPAAELLGHSARLGFELSDGRADAAPRLAARALRVMKALRRADEWTGDTEFRPKGS